MNTSTNQSADTKVSDNLVGSIPALGAPYDPSTDNILQHPARFNFTYALMGGAWLEDSKGNRNWYSFALIQAVHGQQWIDRQLRKQGWMTGCWVTVAAETH